MTTGAQALPGLMICRYTHSVYDANCRQLREEVSTLGNTADPPLRCFCIDASAVDDIDYTAADTLCSIHEFLGNKGIRFAMSQVLDTIKAENRYALGDVFADVGFYDTVDDVVKDYERQAGVRAPSDPAAGRGVQT